MRATNIPHIALPGPLFFIQIRQYRFDQLFRDVIGHFLVILTTNRLTELNGTPIIG